MPKIEKPLPRAVLSENDAERVILQPNIGHPLGLRDRAILETFYSTGIRRAELMHLKLCDLDRQRGPLSIKTVDGQPQTNFYSRTSKRV